MGQIIPGRGGSSDPVIEFINDPMNSINPNFIVDTPVGSSITVANTGGTDRVRFQNDPGGDQRPNLTWNVPIVSPIWCVQAYINHVTAVNSSSLRLEFYDRSGESEYLMLALARSPGGTLEGWTLTNNQSQYINIGISQGWMRMFTNGYNLQAWYSSNDENSPPNNTDWTKFVEWNISVNHNVIIPADFIIRQTSWGLQESEFDISNLSLHLGGIPDAP